MIINISSGGPNDPRTVTVEDENGVIASSKAANLSEVHKALRKGLVDGWGGAPSPAKKAGK